VSTSMKIGDLAKQTGVSTRTLHYYDEIGLLSPSYRTESGHRLYAEQDIIRLQQIISLRALGFSLDEIRECLENVTAFSLQQVIHLHQIRLQEQIALSHTLLSRLNAIARELQMTQSVSIEHLIQAMETITMSEQYFTPEQQAVLEARFREGEAGWQELLTKIRTEMNKGTDLNSPAVQTLVRCWRSMMQAFIGGDRKIYESLVKMYQQEGIETASWRTLDSATFEYILKADSFLTLVEEMQLAVSFEDFTLDIPKHWNSFPAVPTNSPYEVIRFASQEDGTHLLIIFREPHDPKQTLKEVSNQVQQTLAKHGFGNFVTAETTIGSKAALTLDFDMPTDDGTWSCRHYSVAEGTLRYTLGFGTSNKVGMFELYDRMAKSFEILAE
jgi:DNA-binding transcriptional MerR regulator